MSSTPAAPQNGSEDCYIYIFFFFFFFGGGCQHPQLRNCSQVPDHETLWYEISFPENQGYYFSTDNPLIKVHFTSNVVSEICSQLQWPSLTFEVVFWLVLVFFQNARQILWHFSWLLSHTQNSSQNTVWKFRNLGGNVQNNVEEYYEGNPV